MPRHNVELTSWVNGYIFERDVEAATMDEAVAKVLDTIKPDERFMWRERSVRRLKSEPK